MDLKNMIFFTLELQLETTAEGQLCDSQACWNLTGFSIFLNRSQGILTFSQFLLLPSSWNHVFSVPSKCSTFFRCSDLFQKASRGEKRREKFQNQMTIGIQFGETCQIPMCLRHDVMHSSNQY